MKKKIIVLVSLLYTMVILSSAFIVNWGPDSYNAIAYPNSFANVMLRNGRFLQAFFYYIIKLFLSISPDIAFYFSLLISIAMIIIAEYRYADLLTSFSESRKSISTYIFFALLSGITILSIFSTEYFMYFEDNPTWAFAIMVCVEATISFHNYLMKYKLRYLFVTLLFLLLAVFSYQILLAIFVILTLPSAFYFSKNILSFIKNEAIVAILYLIPIATTFVIVKLFLNNSRASGTSIGVAEAVYIFKPEGKTPTQFIFDRITISMWYYAILCLAVAIYLIFLTIRKKSHIEILKGLYISITTAVLGLSPYITKISTDYSPRIYYPLGMLLGILLICTITNKNLVSHNNIPLFFYIILVCAILNQLYANITIFTERYNTNFDDKQLSMIYGNYIDEYEKNTNKKVEFICFYEDETRTKYLSNKGWCISMRVYGVDWGNIEALNFWLNRHYSQGVFDTDIANYFIEKNWNSFDDEQLIFDGNTLHICKY